jgi:hypothetical protein
MISHSAARPDERNSVCAPSRYSLRGPDVSIRRFPNDWNIEGNGILFPTGGTLWNKGVIELTKLIVQSS